MIFEGFGTGESSFTLERGFFFAFGASFFAAASTRLKFMISRSPCAIGQPCRGMAASALLTSRTSSPCTIPRRLLSKRQIFIFRSQRRVVDLAAEREEAPAGGLRVEAEADVAGERMRVAEDALERCGLVEAVRAGHGVERIDGFRADSHRVGEVALEAELRLDVGDEVAVCDSLRFEAILAQDEARGVDFRARRADAQLHRLEVAHLRSGVIGAALLDGGYRRFERGPRVADRAGADAVPAERRERHAVDRVRVSACAGEAVSAARVEHAERLVLRDENVLGDRKSTRLNSSH